MIQIKGGGDPIWRGPNKPVTKRHVTKPKASVTELKAVVTKLENRKAGRPAKYASAAERTHAYRERKKAAAQ